MSEKVQSISQIPVDKGFALKDSHFAELVEKSQIKLDNSEYIIEGYDAKWNAIPLSELKKIASDKVALLALFNLFTQELGQSLDQQESIDGINKHIKNVVPPRLDIIEKAFIRIESVLAIVDRQVASITPFLSKLIELTESTYLNDTEVNSALAALRERVAVLASSKSGITAQIQKLRSQLNIT